MSTRFCVGPSRPTSMAERVAAAADTAAAEGRHITAGHCYMRAGNYYYSAERFIPPGVEKMAMYRKALRAYHAAMERLYPEIERVEVPYEGTKRGRRYRGLRLRRLSPGG